MNASEFVTKLDGVRKTGANRWIARCCAHDDRNPSLTVSEGDDGKILLKCFAGCSIDEIVGAVGVTVDQLFPDSKENHPRLRRPFNPSDVLECIASETMIVATAACNIRAGMVLSDVDHERLLVAAERIFEARRLSCGE